MVETFDWNASKGQIMNRNLSKLLLAAACTLAFSAPAMANDMAVVHKFRGRDGKTPTARLIADGQGNFYGTTSVGGRVDKCSGGGCGTVYRIAADGSFAVLYKFKDPQDGAYPVAGLTLGSDGALYGVTQGGGDLKTCYPSSCGTVFRVTPDGKKKTLYAFAGHPTDGDQPTGAVIFDKHGNTYGTTWFGGTSDAGTVYKLTPDGQETVLYAFKDDGHDGKEPIGALALDKSGNLYGTTRVGGSIGGGIVFKLTPDGVETVLHDFTGGDGFELRSDLMIDKDENLYGTTLVGGASNWGVIFKLTPDGAETVLHSFVRDDTEGVLPGSHLERDAKGDFYGVTGAGGEHDIGTIFRLEPNGALTTLYSFSDYARGIHPAAGVVKGAFGNLYGVARLGGSGRGVCVGDGCGAVFRVTR